MKIRKNNRYMHRTQPDCQRHVDPVCEDFSILNVETTSPPSSAGATLSGCPSISDRKVQDLILAKRLAQQGVRAEQTGQFGGGRGTKPRPQWDAIDAMRHEKAGAVLPTCSASFCAHWMITLFSPSESLLLPFAFDLHRNIQSASVNMVSFHRSSARPRASNPGPRLAEVAGTLMVMFIISLCHCEAREAARSNL